MRIRDELINQAVSRYLGNVQDANDAYMNDAQYHAQIDFMTRLMEIFDLAMEQEGLRRNVRYEILQRVMLAAPDPAEAKKRVEIMKNMKLNPDWPGKTCRW